MTHPNPSVAMAVTLLDEFRRNGIEHVVIAPGSRSAALAMSAASMGFEIHVEIDERSAGFFALGIGMTGTPAIVMTTSGTAVANLLPAVVEADLSGVPMIVLSADRPPELSDRGANQTIQQRGIFGRRVRWEFDPGPAEDRQESAPLWRSMACRAVGSAGGRGSVAAGPVHLNLPFREPLVPSSDDGRVVVEPFEASTAGRPDGSPWTMFERPTPMSLPRSTEPERTLVLLGSGARAAAIDLNGVAYAAEPHSGHRGPEALGSLHYLASHALAEEMRPDRVVTVGRVGLSRPLSAWLNGIDTVAIDPSGRWIDPASNAVAVWREADVPVADPSWLEGLQRCDEAVSRAINGLLDATSTLTEPRVARDTARAVAAADGRLVVASSMPIRDLDLFADVASLDAIANRGASGIDGFVSTVLGIAASQRRPVVGLAGDLSLLHDANGFLLADRPDGVFVVVDNDGGGIFSFLPQAAYGSTFEQLFGTPHGRRFETLADFHGLGYREITEPESLESAVSEAISESGVTLVVIRTDRAENVAFHTEVTRTAHHALDTLQR